MIVVRGDSHEHHIVAPLEFLLDLFVERMLCAAWSAPGGPEIHYDHFALDAGERQFVAVETRNRELHRILELRVWIRLPEPFTAARWARESLVLTVVNVAIPT